jgi:glycosyltransferase involved in cell wall biosynthesis
VRLIFVTSCEEVWGGSEELWWQVAMRLLDAHPPHSIAVAKADNLDVTHPRFQALLECGAVVTAITPRHPFALRIISAVLPYRLRLSWRRVTALRFALAVVRRRPSLVVVTQGQNYDGLRYARVCSFMRVRYVVISQKAAESYWPSDKVRPHYRAAFTRAVAAVFVSEHNLRVTEDQLAVRLTNSVVLDNPVGVPRGEGPLPWPESADGILRLACVGRLHPTEKGQDVVMRILAHDRWRDRPLRVTFYGAGPARQGLQELAVFLGLENVEFAGFVDGVQEVWRTHHALVLPSRAEGLPLALVEALMCGRPAIVSDIGGNSEVITDGETGFLAPGPEVGGFEATMERAWQERERWQAMGVAAAQAIRRRVSPDPAGDLIRVLESAVGASLDGSPNS